MPSKLGSPCMLRFTVLASVVASCAAPKPARPKLAPALESLAFYVGSWDCKGTTFKTSDQAEEHWSAKVIVTPELDGSWLSVQMIGPGANRTIEHKGYDPATKKFVHVAVGLDGSWGTVTSPGWSGSKMPWEPGDKADTTHAVFAKLDDTRYSHGVTRDTEHGVERLWEKVCTKR